jgi:hypothetical protein
VALGQVFSEYFSFLCQFSFHRLLHTHHHLSSGAGTIGQTVAAVPSELSLTPLQEEKKNYSYSRWTSWTPCSRVVLEKLSLIYSIILVFSIKHNRSEMVAVLGQNEALPYYIHTYIFLINFLTFMKPKSSLSFSLKSAIGPHPDLENSNLHPHIIFVSTTSSVGPWTQLEPARGQTYVG